MKRINNILSIAFAGALGLGITACTDGNDWETDGSFNRLFGIDGKNISVEAEETKATVSFSTIQGAEYYVIEFSTTLSTTRWRWAARKHWSLERTAASRSLP